MAKRRNRRPARPRRAGRGRRPRTNGEKYGYPKSAKKGGGKKAGGKGLLNGGASAKSHFKKSPGSIPGLGKSKAVGTKKPVLKYGKPQPKAHYSSKGTNKAFTVPGGDSIGTTPKGLKNKYF